VIGVTILCVESNVRGRKRVKKVIFGIVAIAVATTACGSGDATPEVSASAAPVAAAPAPSAERPAVPAVAEPPAPAAAPKAVAPRPKKAASAPATTERVKSSAPALPEYREFTLPAGTVLPLELKTTLASDESQVEDAVRATLRKAIVVDGYQVLPAGTEVSGMVTDAERAGRVKGRARVAFQFSSLRYDGERYRLGTDPIEQLGEATKGEDAKKIGIGAGVGAAIGALAGGGSGAVKGAAIGAGAGTGVVLATRGKEVRLEPGTEVEARLSSPLAVRVPVTR
jgi:hypothetical protein